MQSNELRDYWGDFQDAAYTGPETAYPVYPLTVDPTDIGSLKAFMMSAGSTGILPTRAIMTRFTLQRISDCKEIDQNGKQLASLNLPEAATICGTPFAPCVSPVERKDSAL